LKKNKLRNKKRSGLSTPNREPTETYFPPRSEGKPSKVHDPGVAGKNRSDSLKDSEKGGKVDASDPLYPNAT